MRRTSLPRLLSLLGLSLTQQRGVQSLAASDSIRVVQGHSRRVFVYEVGCIIISNLIPSVAVEQGVFNQANGVPPSRFACNIEIGKHKSFSDLKTAENGADVGPSPKEICYSALGSCTVMTIRTFFDNTKSMKNSSWADSTLVTISVMLEEVSGAHAHVPAGINMFITLEGTLSKSQKERLLRAANNCPVKQMMNSNLLINSVVAQ